MAFALKNDPVRVVTVRFADVEQMAASIEGADAEVLRRDCGPFQAGMFAVKLEAVALQWIWHTAPLFGWGTTGPAHWCFLLPYGPGAQGTANGHPLDSASLVCYRPGSEQHGAAPHDGRVELINCVASAEALVRASEALGCTEICPVPRLCTLLRPAAGPLAALHSVAETIRAIAMATPELFDGVELRRAFEDELLAALVRATHSDPASDEGREWGFEFRARLAGRAGVLLRASGEEHVSMAGLSAAVGATERQLERAFHTTFGVSPTRYARLWKLHRVHDALCTEPARTTVSAAALQAGFTDLGRFAADYRGVFGENPSETLRHVRP